MSGVDAIERGEVIEENQMQQQDDRIGSYNRRLIKAYFTKSPVTIGALFLIWMVFVI